MGCLISIRAFPLLLPVLFSSLLTQTAFSDDNYLSRVCSTSFDVYTKGSTYCTNLNRTLSGLLNKTATNNGFWQASSGQGPDQVHGLALCRGDVSRGDCRKCLLNASSEITVRCPYRKAAVIWRDYCLLKYSDKDFFGRIHIDENILMWNTKNATNPKKFKATAVDLLRDLSKNAGDVVNNKLMFAKKDILFDKEKNMRIYGMAQCTRDLSKGNCTSCLDAAVNMLPWNIKKGGRQYTSPVGGRTLTGSCYVRYEIYPFLNKVRQ